MTCENYKELLMGYLDEELSSEEKDRLEEHLKECSMCTAELQEFRKLKQITDEVALVEPEDKIWRSYWSNVYNRAERGLGWILFSVAAILLLIYAGFKGIEQIWQDPTIGLLLKIGLLVLIAGLAIMLVSVLRERLYFYKKDRYKDVRR